MLRQPFLLLVLAPALLAQGHLPAPVQPVGERLAATANCGLQLEGEGLLGGGRDYRARFGPDGVRYDAALGSAVPETRFVQLRPTALRRGEHTLLTPQPTAPTATAHRVTYAHADGIDERYDVRPDGIALSWQLRERPAGRGDLVVRYAVATNLGAPAAHGRGLCFTEAAGGVLIGGVTGVDARGTEVPGQLAWVDGGLELSLPGSFVDTASYPLVLDPVLGTQISVSVGLTYDDGEPDAAYDATTGRFLVVWRRTFSATDSDVRGQMVFSVGQLAGSTIFFGSSGTVSPPRVANLGNSDRFGVVWSQLVGGTSSVMYQGVLCATGGLDTATTVDSTTTSVHGPADIGSDPEAYPMQQRGACVVWEDEDFDAIRMQRVYYFNGGSIGLSSQVALLIDGLLGPLYSQPALSRACAADGWLLLAVRRRNPLTGSSAIEARTVRIDGSIMGILGTIASSSNDDLGAPECDGQAGRWVVAHDRGGSGSAYAAVVVTPVEDGGGTTISTGNPVTFGGTAFARASHPTVGYGLGRSWIGFQQVTLLPTSTTTLRVAAIDTSSCANCNDTFVAPAPGGTRIVVATTLSGGDSYREHVLATWHASFGDISAQRLQNYGTTGTTQDLGGGCGNVGSVSFAHEPGIGSNAFSCRLSGIPATALALIFNFAPVTGPIACGACVWTPFVVTQSPPLNSSIVNVQFPIPCVPSLVGSQFEQQWTIIDVTQAPCPLFPGFALSSRTLLTIGQ